MAGRAEGAQGGRGASLVTRAEDVADEEGRTLGDLGRAAARRLRRRVGIPGLFRGVRAGGRRADWWKGRRTEGCGRR